MLSPACIPEKLGCPPFSIMEAAGSGTHLSRHFLTCQPQKARNLPFAPAGAANADGMQLAHKLLAVGSWNEDDEVRCLACAGNQLRVNASVPRGALPTGAA